MGKQRAAPPPNDNLTISRIHILLRPFETKLNVLAKALERKIANDKYAPKARQPGVTYAKRHRIRAMTGMSSRQAGRAYALEKSKGLSTLYSFHEQLIGVEDSFRNLIRGTTLASEKSERIPSLQALVCKMIGRQVAEETLRDKEELEEEGVDDCIGLWYGGLAVHCRKYALVAHAVQLVELKIPFFILELWKGLLVIAMEAGLQDESYILLEVILLYYFTPDDPSSDSSPAKNMTGRDLTDLYNQFIVHLPPAEFLAIILPVLEQLPPIVWSFRCISHLIRSLDEDVVLLAKIVESMIQTLACHSSDDEAKGAPPMRNLRQNVESKCFAIASSISLSATIDAELVQEVDRLTSSMVRLGRIQANGYRILGMALSLDLILLYVLDANPSLQVDSSGIVTRLRLQGSSQENDENEEQETAFVVAARILRSIADSTPSLKSSLKLPSSVSTISTDQLLLSLDLDTLSSRIQDAMACLESAGEDVATAALGYRYAPNDGGTKRKSALKGSTDSGKRRKLSDGKYASGKRRRPVDESEAEDSTETESGGEWNATDNEEEIEEDEDEITTVDEGRSDTEERTVDEDDRTTHSLSRNEAEDEMPEDGEEDDLAEWATPSQARERRRARIAQLHHLYSPTKTQKSEIDAHDLSITSYKRFMQKIPGPPPLLRSVATARTATTWLAKIARRTQEVERFSSSTMPSSDDDLDLLGRDTPIHVSRARRREEEQRGYDRWSTP